MKRLASIDAARALAILAVICIHTQPFSALYGNNSVLVTALNYLYSFALPFFFVAAGYFFAKRAMREGEVIGVFQSYAKRLLMVFAVWSALYIAIPSSTDVIDHGFMKSIFWNLSSAIKLAIHNPVTFILQGTSSHLWFLTALIYGLATLTLLIRLGLQRLVFPVSFLLLALGLLGGAYSFLYIGYTPSFNTRGGPFFSTMCVAFGWWLSRRGKKHTLALGASVAVVGLCLEFFEHWLIPAHGSEFPSYMLLGSLPFGAGVFMVALAAPQLGENTLLPALGKFTLGVYLCHWMIINALLPVRFLYHSPIWEIAFPLLVYALSLGLTAAMLRWRYTAKLVPA